ncbi:Dabb family protein [Chryseobacterium gossypii]|uniref:Dabb family protein n=1 Tax=Chryseobacterium gossypii TaxID=3231602 RepID=UPI003526BB7B
MKKNYLKKMRSFIKTLSLGILLICVLATFTSCDDDPDDHPEEQRIEHLVLFKFRPDITVQQKQEIISRFMALKNSLKNGKPYLNVEYGFQNSMESVKGDYDIGFRVTFSSIEDRDYYVGKPFLTAPGTYDPMHDDFKNFVGPYLDSDPANPNKGVLVLDYKSNEKGNGSVPATGYRLDHWVLFKFKSGITEPEKQEVINRFLALKNSQKNGSPYITLLEYGYQNSKESVKGDYDIGFRVSFTSEADRDYYVGKPFLTAPGTYDPMHDDFKNFVGPYLDSDPANPNKGVLVFDYEVIR